MNVGNQQQENTRNKGTKSKETNMNKDGLVGSNMFLVVDYCDFQLFLFMY